MPKPATTRLGLAQYEDSENASFSAQINAITSRLDAIVMRFEKGTFAGRRAAGIAGAYYLATDGVKSGASEGDLYYDTGAAWVGPRNVLSGIPVGGLIDSALPGDVVDIDGVTRLLVCDGRAISRTTYKALFEKVNAVTGLLKAWGEGNGTTTFNIPNFVGRVAVHPGGSGVTNNGTGALNGLAQKGGEQNHTLAVGEIPDHQHHLEAFNKGGEPPFTEEVAGKRVVRGDTVDGGGGHGLTLTYSGAFSFGVTVGSVDAVVGGSHNTMQPYVGVYKLIRVL